MYSIQYMISQFNVMQLINKFIHKYILTVNRLIN